MSNPAGPSRNRHPFRNVWRFVQRNGVFVVLAAGIGVVILLWGGWRWQVRASMPVFAPGQTVLWSTTRGDEMPVQFLRWGRDGNVQVAWVRLSRTGHVVMLAPELLRPAPPRE
jgi:hypothetical protein